MTALKQRCAAILRRLPEGGRMVEVGVLRGLLSEAILSARPDVTVVMVDSWLGVEDQPESYRATRDDHALASSHRALLHKAEAERRVRRFGGRAVIVHEPSIEAAAFTWKPFDLVFLDADHSEDGVRADIAAWWPHVKAGGWIGGHDYDNREPKFDFSGVKRAVDAEFDNVELDANYTWWARA